MALWSNTALVLRATSLPPIAGFTAMLWAQIYVDSNGIFTFFRYGSTGGASDLNYRLGTNTDTGLALAVRSAGNVTVNGGLIGPVLRWHHVAIVVSGTGAGQCLGVVDGKLVVTQSGSTTAVSQELAIGCMGSGAQAVALCAFKCWNRALSLRQIQQEMGQYVPLETSGLNTFSPLRSFTEASINYAGAHDLWTVSGTWTVVPGPPIPWELARRRTVVPAPAAYIPRPSLYSQAVARAARG